MSPGYHQIVSEPLEFGAAGLNESLNVKFDFAAHFHPFVDRLRAMLDEGGLDALQEADTASPPLRETFFNALYKPSGQVRARPVKELDFSPSGAYALYNWELFYHLPMLVARHLTRASRFDEAQRWLHLLFDPTTDDATTPEPQRYWRSEPLRKASIQSIESVLVNLATGADGDLQQLTIDAIAEWTRTPFEPHVVASYRQGAYAVFTVMAYLDNLIAWGDSLFVEGSRESINEALQLYLVAAGILGQPPQESPRRPTPSLSYEQIRARRDAFSNVLVDIESGLPLDTAAPGTGAGAGAAGSRARGVLYFCVASNPRLLGYWDTVADRLYKIRNSLDIRGVFRQLPLFEPPIDPALLAKAAAAGVDVNAVVSGAAQPLPLLRSQPLIQRALEIVQELKSLTAARLGALEKEENEKLAAMRASHEARLLELGEAVRFQSLLEATKAKEGVLASLGSAAARYQHYGTLLGLEADKLAVPELDELDGDALDKLTYTAVEPDMPTEPFRSLFPASGPGSDIEFRTLSDKERVELVQLDVAAGLRTGAAALDLLAPILSLIPEFSVDIKFWGIGGGFDFGGKELAAAAGYIASGLRASADVVSHMAGRTQKMGGYERREQEWVFQKNQIALEIKQIFIQLRAAQLREHIAARELENQRTQIEQAQAVEHFLTDDRTGKVTKASLYAYQKRECQGLERRCLDLALEVARKAERAVQHELGRKDMSWIGTGYTAGQQGLLAGERLWLDLKRMEVAYHDLNEREYERTASISLLAVDPVALVELRATGRCRFTLPEEVFDLDGPEYFRRMRGFAVSLPCVTGPHIGVSCRVSQLRSQIRTGPTLLNGTDFARDGQEDPRFEDYFGAQEAVVTSTGVNDAGLFDPSGGDGRRLPGEGRGPIGDWSLELPSIRRFDYDTISDVVLHVRYTSREGGAAFREHGAAHLDALVKVGTAAGVVRLLDLRHEFPTEWAAFVSGRTAALKIELRPEHYPYWSRGRLGSLARVEAFSVGKAKTLTITAGARPGKGTVQLANRFTGARPVRSGVATWAPPQNAAVPATGAWALAPDDALDDLCLALTWGKA